MSVFVLPEGLLFPHVEADGVTGEVSVGRLRIRKAEQSGSKYHTVAGSSMTPLCIGLRRTFPVVVVESDLDAMLVSQEAGDLVGVVALGSVTNRPDEETFRILRRVPLIIVSLDSDPPAARESRQWRPTAWSSRMSPGHPARSAMWNTPFSTPRSGRSSSEGSIRWPSRTGA